MYVLRTVGNRPWPTAETLRTAGTKKLDHALYGDYDVRVQGLLTIYGAR